MVFNFTSCMLLYIVDQLKHIFGIDGTTFDQSAKLEEMKVAVNTLWCDIHSCVGLAKGRMSCLCLLFHFIMDAKEMFLNDQEVPNVGDGRQNIFESFCDPIL